MSLVVAGGITLVVSVTVAAVVRLSGLRRTPQDLSKRVLLLTLICFDVGLLFGIPAVYRFVYDLLGQTPGLPQLLQHVATIGMAFFAQVFALALTNPPDSPDVQRRLRQRQRVLVVALVTLVCCYVLGPLRLGLYALGAHGEHDLGAAAYVAATQLYVAAALADIARWNWTPRRTERPFLRIGLRAFGLGCVFGVLFSVHKLFYYMLTALGVRLPWDENGNAGIQLVFLAPAVLCFTAGIVIPFWGPRVAAYHRRRTAYRQLEPLAAALIPAGKSSGAMPWRGSHVRLLHRVIGIRDALIGPLHGRLRVEVYERAYRLGLQSGLPADEAKIMAEASCIAVALRSPPLAKPPPAEHTPPPFTLDTGLDSEAAWLARVSQAYASSGLVDAVLTSERLSR